MLHKGQVVSRYGLTSGFVKCILNIKAREINKKIQEEKNMKAYNVGIDVGNSDTKSSTQGLSIPTGFMEFATLPYGADDYVMYKGKYYIPDETRFPYVEDKTKDDKCFILSIFAMAQDMVKTVSKRASVEAARMQGREQEKEQIQKELDKIRLINLGVGLPPNHYAMLNKALVKYYTDYLKNGISYEYNGYHLNFKLGLCKVFPQDYAAVVLYNADEDSFIKKAKMYYAIDIGGYTVDVVPIIKGQPDGKRSDSFELGVLKMYAEIRRRVKRDTGATIDDETVRSVLDNEYTILDDGAQALIHSMARDWFEMIINTLRQSGIEFDAYPVVFLGGGASRFRKYIKENKIVKKYEIISGANSNAIGFKKLIIAIANMPAATR